MWVRAGCICSNSSIVVMSACRTARRDWAAALNVLGDTPELVSDGGGLELEDGLGAAFVGFMGLIRGGI